MRHGSQKQSVCFWNPAVLRSSYSWETDELWGRTVGVCGSLSGNTVIPSLSSEGSSMWTPRALWCPCLRGCLDSEWSMWISRWCWWGRTLLSEQEMQETRVQSPGWKDPTEEEVTTHSSILAWRIPWTEELSGLQSMGSQRVGHNWGDLARMHGKNLETEAFTLRTRGKQSKLNSKQLVGRKW